MQGNQVCSSYDHNVELSIVMPCYNEEEVLPLSIPPLLNLCRELNLQYEVVLVNNGCWDSTPKVIDSFASQGYPVRRVDVTVNQGYGWGIICGLKEARGKFVAYMCCDGQIHPDDVIRAYRLIQSSERGVITKVRRINRADGWWRRFVSYAFNLLFLVMFGVITRDVNATPKFFHRDDLEVLKPVMKDSFIDSELMIKAKALGFKIVEMSAIFHPRQGGRSKVGMLLNSPEFMKNMIEFRWGRGLKEWRAQLASNSLRDFEGR